jgi:DNA-binding response OmpR family regulator
MTSIAAVGEWPGLRVAARGGPNEADESDETHRILAVDDDESLLEMMVATLAGQRYHVDVATTCKDALPLILFRDYCGIILDLLLPDANGLSLYRHIAQRRPGLRSRVIFVTGAMDRDEADRFVQLIDNRVLLKPFRLNDLLNAVREIDARAWR